MVNISKRQVAKALGAALVGTGTAVWTGVVSIGEAGQIVDVAFQFAESLA